MSDEISGKSGVAEEKVRRSWSIVGWLLLGALVGAVLAVLFFAYGQPALLLEQLNLRYCG